MLNESEAEAIRRLTDAARRSGRWDWEREAAARTGGLPVYASIGGVLVVMPDGSVLSMDNNSGAVEDVPERGWILLAMKHAAEKYPELRGLAPVRPPGATDCTACAGVGRVMKDAFDCGECWGTGWRE